MPSAILKEHSRKHNGGVNLEHLALLHLLRLKDVLKSTVTSLEFLELKDFKAAAAIIGNDNFWKDLFLMCCALYAPMRVLRVADLKTPAMDKLYFYVLQADHMLLQYLKEAEEHVRKGAITELTLNALTLANSMSHQEEDENELDISSVVESNSSDDDSDSSDDLDDKEENKDNEEDNEFFEMDALGGGIMDDR